MPDSMTAEEQYRLLAATARGQADLETDSYARRRLFLSAQHYDVLAERAKRAVEMRRMRKRKSA